MNPWGSGAEERVSLVGCFPGDPHPHPHLQVDEEAALDFALPPYLFANEPETRARTSTIQGSLASMPLADLVGLLDLGQRTGLLVIRAPRGEARLWLEAGQIVHVAYGSADGVDAFSQLVADARGEFEFHEGAARPPARSVSISTTSLLVEAAQRVDLSSRGLPAGAPATSSPGIATPARPDGLPEIGSVVDKYRIEELLGTGGFAAVYRATHLILRTTVALKLLKPEVVLRHPAHAERMCEEARFAAQLNHASIVRVFDVTHTPRLTYIVMEYIEGASLARAIRTGGALDTRRVLWLGIQVALGLKAALEGGLIHRDIKPANLLLSKGGGVKIVDLGLATEIGSADSWGDGTVVGTPNYMSPEQAYDPGRTDFRSDIYSLGVTLYHAAVGRLPFSSPDPVEVVRLHQTASVPPPHEVQPGFPSEASRLLLWMLEKDPAARPQSYDQLISGLEEAIETLTLGLPDIGSEEVLS